MRILPIGLFLLLAGCVQSAPPATEPRCVVTPVGLVECDSTPPVAG